MQSIWSYTNQDEYTCDMPSSPSQKGALIVAVVALRFSSTYSVLTSMSMKVPRALPIASKFHLLHISRGRPGNSIQIG